MRGCIVRPAGTGPGGGVSVHPYPSRRVCEQGVRTCLHRGKWGNADVWRVEMQGLWVVKDFSARAALVRWTLGVCLVCRELCILRKLDGLKGIPEGVSRVDRFALCERYIEGCPLRALGAGEAPVSFFERLEGAVQAMHARGIVHLDLRNGGNILMDASETPWLLDFQSAISVRWLPGPLRRRLEWIDLSGIYKHWARVAPDTQGEARERVLIWLMRHRKWWRFRGYRLSLGQRRLKTHERLLLAKYEKTV